MIVGGKILISHQVRSVAESALAFSEYLSEYDFEENSALLDALATSSQPQIVTVIGQTGSGKSSTLNHLARENFCTHADDQPTLTRWLYSPRPEPHTHEWIETKFYPSDVLLNLEFWDTLGLELPNAFQRLKHIVPKSDVILATISTLQPNQDILWDYLQEIDREILDRVILVITQADLISYEDLMALKNEIRRKSKELLGIQLNLFHLDSKVVEVSQAVINLENYVQEVLVSSIHQKKYTQLLISLTAKLIGQQQSILHNQHRLARLDAGFIVSIDREIDQIQHKVEQQINESVKLYTDIFLGLIPRLAKKVARQLGKILTPRRTMVLTHLTPVVYDWFYDLTRTEIETHYDRFARELLQSCENHWNQVRPRMKEQMDCDIGEFQRDSLQQLLKEYQSRLGKSVYKPMQKLHIKKFISHLYKDQKQTQTTQLIIVLFLLSLGGILGTLDEQKPAFMFLTLAGATWIICSLSMMWSHHKLIKTLIKQFHRTKPLVRQIFQEPTAINMMGGLTDYRLMYKNIKGQVTNDGTQLEDILKKNNALHYQITVLEKQQRSY